MPRVTDENSPFSYDSEIVYNEVNLEDRKWMSAVRMYIGDLQKFDYGNEIAVRLVASLYHYLTRHEVTFPKTWQDGWKRQYQYRWWYPTLAKIFKFTEPEFVTWEAEALFPELKAFERHHTIKYIVHPKRLDG